MGFYCKLYFSAVLLAVLFHDHLVSGDCDDLDLGMKSGAISDNNVAASSELNASTPAKNGRLNYTAGSSWCASTSDSNPYLRIDLQTLHIICSVSTQGNSQGNQWVETYTLQSSTDGTTWTDYKEYGEVKTFQGNEDRNRENKNILYEGILTRWLRFVLKTSHNRFCMRTEIFGVKLKPENLAAGKASAQSSTFANKLASGESSKAVDGNPDTDFRNGHCTHTKEDNPSWWLVDLGSDHMPVSEVRIVNRLKYYDVNYFKRNEDYKITLGNNLDVTSNHECVGRYSFIKFIASAVCYRNPLTTGRYVGIMTTNKQFLQLCEVEIYSRENLALGKTTTQSSSYLPSFPYGNSSEAVDGNSNAFFNEPPRSCTHTSLQTNPWWRVDLGQVEPVTEVYIVNRGDDCCWKRLNPFEIRVGITSRNGGIANPKCGDGNYSVPRGQGTSFFCRPSLYGRYVTIRIVKTSAGVLTLCEVEVYSARRACQIQALGVTSSYKFPSGSFSASSSRAGNEPYEARLNGNGSWSPSTDSNANDSLQINLHYEFFICAIATQGNPTADHWTTKYKFLLSLYGKYWITYQENGTDKIFNANDGRSDIVKHNFVEIARARFVRFQPTDFVTRKALRVELYGVPKSAGNVSRECSQKSAQGKIYCSSAEFIILSDQMKAIIAGGVQADLEAQQVLSQLRNATQLTKNDTIEPKHIYGGDLVIAVNILVQIAKYNGHQGNLSSTQDIENYANVASNLLEPVNIRTWKELYKSGQNTSQILVKAIDDYGIGVAGTLNTPTKSKVVRTKNLMLRIDRLPFRSKGKGLKIAYKKSSIYLPPQVFSSSQDSSVVTVVYLTLNDVLLLEKEKENEHGQAISANTTIVSGVVYPRSSDVLSEPVKIVLQNKKKRISSDATSQRKCVFWRPEGSATWKTSGCRLVPSESNVAMTTCECDHLTIFAALMDPYGLTGNEDDKEALEIISIVGCSISLLAVFITIIALPLFCRPVKKRIEVLLNLCAAIAITCALVISEGSARNKAGCPVVAALLHYFLLSLFSWMLCEGVLHYIIIVLPFGREADVQEKMKYFYFFGWGFPAVIVTISLAVTQADGYGSTAACWLDAKSGLIWAFIGPALAVILINIVVYILVIRRMMKPVAGKVKGKTQIEKLRTGVKASAAIFPLLGITWLFGILSFNSNTTAFKYIFAILNSLQGLMIFIFHSVREIREAVTQRLNIGSKRNLSNPDNSGNLQSKEMRSRGAKTEDEKPEETKDATEFITDF